MLLRLFLLITRDLQWMNFRLVCFGFSPLIFGGRELSVFSTEPVIMKVDDGYDLVRPIPVFCCS